MKKKPHQRYEAQCIDCGKTFMRYSPIQVRCAECQKARRKQKDHERWIAVKNENHMMREELKKTKSMVVNGHVQVCTHLKSCYYGQSSEKGCSYLIEEGQSRIMQGFYIVDGKCPAYRRKVEGQRPKRNDPPARVRKPEEDITSDDFLLVQNKKEFIDV